MTDTPEIPEIELQEPPADRLTIKYKGESRELFMSFMRQNALLRYVDNPTTILTIGIDPDLSEAVIRAMLVEKISDIHDFNLEEGDVSNEDAEKITDWVSEHLTYFFMKRFQSMAERGKRLEPIAKALQLSVAGSGGSGSETAPAGPSA